MSRTSILVCIGVCAALLAPAALANSTGPLTPVSGQATGITSWTINTNVTSLRACNQSLTGAGTQWIALLEYPLHGIPDDATVTAAYLKLNVTATPQAAPLGFYGYSGNGVIEASDVNWGSMYIGMQSVSAPGEYTASLNTSYIQSVIAGPATHLGVAVRHLLGDTTFDAHSELTIAYTPEPASLSLLALGGFTLLRRKQR